ncbi:MAG: 2-oxoisovalerate dehydrogenase [Candidatus Omnitrophica bacterium]|nr:2-oxoisovalerate dehydrogenase [Candidatus Omnitrophota bacterium]
MRDAEIIFLVEEDVEGGLTARAIGQGIFTQADTLELLKVNIKDALVCHFGDLSKIPAIVRLHIVHEEMLSYA